MKREWSASPGSAGALAGPIVYAGRTDLTESARTANNATLPLSVIPLAHERPGQRRFAWSASPGSAGALAGPIVYAGRKDLRESARAATTTTLPLSTIPLAQDRPCRRRFAWLASPGSAGALAGPIVYVGRKDLTESARTANSATLRLRVIPVAQDRPCHRRFAWSASPRWPHVTRSSRGPTPCPSCGHMPCKNPPSTRRECLPLFTWPTGPRWSLIPTQTIGSTAREW